MNKNIFFISTFMSILLTAAVMVACGDVYEESKKTDFSTTPSVDRNSALVFSANGQTVTLDNSPITPTFTVSCNQPWIVRSYQTWLTVERSEKEFTLTVTKNTDMYERKATLLLEGGEAYYTWIVTQLPAN